MSHRIKYISQLDALRAVAAFLVIFYHYIPAFGMGTFVFGKYGVQIFFTISGFLITAILLEQKESNSNRLKLIKNFIIKRALRLFPIYYLVLFFFTVLSTFGFYVWKAGEGIYYYTYTTNILFYMKDMRGIQLNHLWTLAVEEQFYLVWPLLLLFFPRKKEWILILLFILTSLTYKIVTTHINYNMLTVSHFDTLGTGAMLAYLLKQNYLEQIKTYVTFFIFLIILLLLTYYLLNRFDIANANSNSFLVLILSAVLVFGCNVGFKGAFGKVLDLKILKYFGQISYGLYLYHKFIPYFLKLFIDKLDIQIHAYVLMSVSIILTILISHISYQFIEKRFILLKEKFDL